MAKKRDFRVLCLVVSLWSSADPVQGFSFGAIGVSIPTSIHRRMNRQQWPRPKPLVALYETNNTGSGDSGKDGASTASVNTRTNTVRIINLSLFAFYSIVGMAVIPKVTAGAMPSRSSSTAMTTLIISTMWMTFVLAISGMEAWLKFRAPFVPKPLALDIGRTIFPALNAVELAFCLSLWWCDVLSMTVATTTTRASRLWYPTLVLLMDILVLTPKLVLRGKQTVLEYVEKHPKATKVSTDSTVFVNLKQDIGDNKPTAKQDKSHLIYVLLELLKLLGLGTVMKSALCSMG